MQTDQRLQDLLETNTRYLLRARKAEDISRSMLTVSKECLKAEKQRRARLKPGSPASTYTNERIVKLQNIISEAEEALQEPWNAPS